LAATVFIVAGVLGGIGLAMSAWMPGLRQALGVFLALLASNVVILTTVTGKETTTLRAQAQALATCVDILIMLFVLGVVREIVGRGSLFTGASRLLGDLYAGFEVALFRLDMGFLLALLPPGAFIAAGLSIAALRLADAGRRREPSQ
jgi:electron transport complex protein RnfE